MGDQDGTFNNLSSILPTSDGSSSPASDLLMDIAQDLVLLAENAQHQDPGSALLPTFPLALQPASVSNDQQGPDPAAEQNNREMAIQKSSDSSTGKSAPLPSPSGASSESLDQEEFYDAHPEIPQDDEIIPKAGAAVGTVTLDFNLEAIQPAVDKLMETSPRYLDQCSPHHPARIFPEGWTSLDFEGGLPPSPDVLTPSQMGEEPLEPPFLETRALSCGDEGVPMQENREAHPCDQRTMVTRLAPDNGQTKQGGSGPAQRTPTEETCPGATFQDHASDPVRETPTKATQDSAPSSETHSCDAGRGIKTDNATDDEFETFSTSSLGQQEDPERAASLATPEQLTFQHPRSANEELEQLDVLEKDKDSVHGSDSGVSSEAPKRPIASKHVQNKINDWFLKTPPEPLRPGAHLTNAVTYTVTTDNQGRGAEGGPAEEPRQEFSSTPTVRMKEFNVGQLRTFLDNSRTDVTAKELFNSLLSQIPKRIRSIKTKENQIVKNFSPSLVGSDFLAPDARASHEIFRRGSITNVQKLTDGDAIITVRHDCPTAQPDCQTNKCPHCTGKDYELAEYLFPSRGGLEKNWQLIISEHSELGDLLTKLNEDFRQLLSFFSDPQDLTVNPDDSVSQISDITNFPRDPDPSAASVPLQWRTTLNWTSAALSLTGAAELKALIDQHKDRKQSLADVIQKLEVADLLPCHGNFSLPAIRSQTERFFRKQEQYLEKILDALKCVKNRNCQTSVQPTVFQLSKTMDDFFSECREITSALQRRFYPANNLWKTRPNGDGTWEAYKCHLPDPPAARESPKRRSKTRSRASSPNIRPSPTPREKTSTVQPQDRSEVRHKVQQRSRRRSNSPDSTSSSSGSDSDEPNSSSSVYSASTVLHRSAPKGRSEVPLHRDVARLRIDHSSDPDCQLPGSAENEDFARIVGHKEEMDLYLDTVNQNITQFMRGQGTRVVSSVGKLQVAIRGMVDAMVKHGQPSFDEISNFSEAQLKEEVDVGNSERLKLQQRVSKEQTAVELALTTATTAYLSSKRNEHLDWKDALALTEGLITGPNGRTHTELSHAWDKFFLNIQRRVRAAAEKRNVMKNGYKSSMAPKQLELPKFSGGPDTDNFYVWLGNLDAISAIAGYTESEKKACMKGSLKGLAESSSRDKTSAAVPTEELQDFLQARFGQPSVIVSQLKDRHRAIGTLNHGQLTTNDRQDQTVVMSKLDAHLHLITDVEQVELGLANFYIKKLPAGATEQEMKKMRRKATKQVFTDEYLRYIRFLVPAMVGLPIPSITARAKDKFKYAKANLISWRDHIQTDMQHRPTDLRSATATVLATTREDKVVLTATAEPVNPPQKLVSEAPGGTVPTKLQDKKKNAREKAGGAPSKKKDKPSKTEPGRCPTCKAKGEHEYHSKEDCPYKSSAPTDGTPYLHDRVCVSCRDYPPKYGQQQPKQPHVLKSGRVARQFCASIAKMKVSELAAHLANVNWCLTCIVPPDMHGENTGYDEATRTCNKKIWLQCKHCKKAAKACVEHHEQNKEIHDQSAEVAKELGIPFNCSLVIQKEILSPEGAHEGNHIALFNTSVPQPQLLEVDDKQLRDELYPKAHILQACRIELEDGHQSFVLFDNGSTENITVSKVAGRHIKAVTDPNAVKVGVRGLGGLQEVRTLKINIPIKHFGPTAMVFQEASHILYVNAECHLPLLALVKREHSARSKDGTLLPGDTRSSLEGVTISTYGGPIEFLFGIPAAVIQPHTLFRSVYGVNIFTTILDTGDCPPYGLYGESPDLVEYEKFVVDLEAKKQNAVKQVNEFLNLHNKISEITQRVTLVSSSDKEEEHSTLLDLGLPNLPGWVSPDLEKRMKMELRHEGETVLMDRVTAMDKIKGADTVVSRLEREFPKFFLHFCGDSIITFPQTDWELLAEAAALGKPLLGEAASWIWSRSNSLPDDQNGKYTMGITQDSCPGRALGYVCGLVSSPTEAPQDPADWADPKAVLDYIRGYTNKASASGMTDEDVSGNLRAVLDTFSAPLHIYSSWFDQLSLYENKIPHGTDRDSWHSLLTYYPLFLADLNGLPHPHSPPWKDEAPKRKPKPGPAAPKPATNKSQQGSTHQAQVSATSKSTLWIKSEQFKDTYYLGVLSSNLSAEQRAKVSFINKWLEPQYGELKTHLVFAKRLGRNLGKHAEEGAALKKISELGSTFLSIPLLGPNVTPDGVFMWMQMACSLLSLTNLSRPSRKRFFIRAVHPNLTGSLVNFDPEGLTGSSMQFLMEFFRVISASRNLDPPPRDVWQKETCPPFGGMKELTSGCATLSNAILDPGKGDETRNDGLTPISVPVLNSLDSASLKSWALICRNLINYFELSSTASNKLIYNSVALAIRPALHDFLTTWKNAHPAVVLLGIQNRLERVNLSNTFSSMMITNMKDFFLNKLTAVRRQLPAGVLSSHCQAHQPDPCDRFCCCLGCARCGGTSKNYLMYSKKQGKYLWIQEPNDECFSCQGRGLAADGTPCLEKCHFCSLINKVLPFSFDDYQRQGKTLDPEHLPGTGSFDGAMVRQYDPFRRPPPDLGALFSNHNFVATQSPASLRVDEMLRKVATPDVGLSAGHLKQGIPSNGQPETIVTVSDDEARAKPALASTDASKFFNPAKDSRIKDCTVRLKRLPKQEDQRPDEAAKTDLAPDAKPGVEECGYACKNGCIRSEGFCAVLKDLPERYFLLERRDRLPLDSDIADMDSNEVLFWADHFKSEDLFGSVDYTRRDLYNQLVDCRRRAWMARGCFTCRSALTQDEQRARASCPSQCEDFVAALEFTLQQQKGLFMEPGRPVPSLKPGTHVPRPLGGPKEALEWRRRSKASRAAPITSSRPHPDHCVRTLLRVQHKHQHAFIDGVSCCATTTRPAILFDTKRDQKKFNKMLDLMAAEHLDQDSNGNLMPGIRSKYEDRPKSSALTLKANNDDNTDILLTGLFRCYHEHRDEMHTITMRHPHYEISLACTQRCKEGCLTPDFGCYCEGCPLCGLRPSISKCYASFANQIKDELLDMAESSRLASAVLHFNVLKAQDEASFLARAAPSHLANAGGAIQQVTARLRMDELKKLTRDYPEFRFSSTCQEPCRTVGGCLGAHRDCLCDGCDTCSPLLGLGHSYLPPSEFVRRLGANHDKITLGKVRALYKIDFQRERETLEYARQNPPIPVRQPPALPVRRAPRLPFFGSLLALFTLFGLIVGERLETTKLPMVGPSWPQAGFNVDYDLSSSSNFWNSTPGTARSATLPKFGRVDLPDWRHEDHPVSWMKSDSPQSLNRANGFYLWSASSAVALSATRQMMDRLLRCVSNKMTSLLSSLTSLTQSSSSSVKDKNLNLFLMRNTKEHRAAYWRVPQDPNLKKEIDEEFRKLGKVALAVVEAQEPLDEPDSLECTHCLAGCAFQHETSTPDDQPQKLVFATQVEMRDIMETFQEDNLGPFIRCKRCRACKDCSHVGERMNKRLNQDQEQEYIRNNISFHPKEGEPGKYEVYMEYPKREGWEKKLAPNRDNAIRNLRDITKSLLAESEETQQMVVNQWQKLLDNKFVQPVSEIPGWQKLVDECPIPGGYYSTHTLAFKPNSANTEVRLCANFSKECSTGFCFNNILVAGETFYNFATFSEEARARPALAGTDVSKFFNSVKLVDKDKVLCRVIWYKGNKITLDENNWVEFCLCTGWYGASSQPCVMEHVKDKILTLFPHLLNVSKQYVDDILVSMIRAALARAKMQLLIDVFDNYGLKAKGIAVSGEEPDASMLSNSGYVDIAGMNWDTKKDLVRPVINSVFMGNKVKGRLVAADIYDGSSLDEILQWGKKFTWTIKHIMQHVARTWDYAYGIISPLRGDLSVILRAAHDWAHCQAVVNGTDRKPTTLWQTEIPDFLRDRLLRTLQLIQDQRQFWYPRCRVSTEELKDPDNPVYDLVTFVDAGKHCIQVIHYLLWLLKDDTWRSSFLWATNKLRPVMARKPDGTQAQQTMPKSEMAAMAIGAAGAMGIKAENPNIRKSWMCTDATTAILWSTSPHCQLDAFTNPRVQVVRDAYPCDQILHVRTVDQPADTGTKGVSNVDQVGPDSPFFLGPSFLSKGVEACMGKELLTPEQIALHHQKGVEQAKQKLEDTNHPPGYGVSAMDKLEQISREMAFPKQHLTNLLVSEIPYFAQHGKGFDQSRAEVKVTINSEFTRPQLLSILTLLPRMDFSIDRDSNTLSLYSKDDSVALPHKRAISTRPCDFSAVCFLAGRVHNHSELSQEVHRQADEYLPSSRRAPSSSTARTSPSPSLLNEPSTSAKQTALQSTPSVTNLSGKSAKEIQNWARMPNHVYLGLHPSVPFNFLEEYWTCSQDTRQNFESTFRSNMRSVRTVPFLKGKVLGCDCRQQTCIRTLLVKIFKDYYQNGPQSLFNPTVEAADAPTPKFSDTLQNVSSLCAVATAGNLKRMVKQDDCFLSVLARPFDRVFCTVSLTFMSAEKWMAICSKSAKVKSTQKWKRRLQNIRNKWETDIPYMTELFPVNPLDKLMGSSPDQQGRHTNPKADPHRKKVPSLRHLDKFFRTMGWYSYPGFSMMFEFCRSILNESELSFEKLSFQFTSLVLLLSSLLRMSKTKNTRPGLFTACRTALLWVRHACNHLEANMLAALLDLPDLPSFYGPVQTQRLQPQTQKRFLLRDWNNNFDLPLEVSDPGQLPRYVTRNQVSILFETANECKRLFRQAGKYLTLKTQQSHAAFIGKEGSKKRTNKDGVVLSPRRIRQTLNMVETCTLLEGEEADKLRDLHLNPNVPYIPSSPLMLAVLTWIHFFFRHSPVNLFSNTKHRSIALDVMLFKTVLDGPGVTATLTRMKERCFTCQKRTRKTLQALCGGNDDTNSPNASVNDRVFADLAGPFKVGPDTYHILVWVCAATGYCACWPLRDRSKSSFVQAFQALANLHNGYPSEIYADSEGGLISAVDGALFEETDAKNFQSIRVALRLFVCAGYNHQAHGAVERRVRSVKEHLGSLNWKAHTFQDFVEAIIASVRILNTTPIAARVQGEKNPLVELICPQDLMTPGRTSNVSSPIVFNDTYEQMHKRLQAFKDMYINTWRNVVINTRLTSQVFREQSAEPAVGDVVVTQDPKSFKPKIQMGIITNLLPSEDGIVRKVEIKLAERSKVVNGSVNNTFSIRSVRDLCVIPKIESEVSQLTLELMEKQKLFKCDLPETNADPEDDSQSASDEDDEEDQSALSQEPEQQHYSARRAESNSSSNPFNARDLSLDPSPTLSEGAEVGGEIETQPLDHEGGEDNLHYQQGLVRPCRVMVERLHTGTSRGSSEPQVRPRPSSSRRTSTTRGARSQLATIPEVPTRVLRSSQTQGKLTLALLASLIFSSEALPLNMTQQNATLTELPEVITTVGYDVSTTYTNKTPLVKHLNLLTSHTCEVDETRYDEAQAIQLQAVFTQSMLDVEVMQCRALVSVSAAWCGSNTGTVQDSRMHAPITVISPTVLDLTAEQCRRLVENGTIIADIYDHPGPKELVKRFKEFDVPYGFSTRKIESAGTVKEDHACSPPQAGLFNIAGNAFKQHVAWTEIEFLVRRHKAVYESSTDHISVPNLVRFSASQSKFFDNEHGTFALTDDTFVKPDRCARTTHLFSGIAHYYARSIVGQQAEGEQMGDIVTMKNKDNHTVAFVTAGTTEFCGIGPVFRTNMAGVHLIQYNSEPPFQGAPTSSFGVDPYLSLKDRIISTSVAGDLDIQSVAFSLRQRTCQLNTISNLVKLRLLASMPESKLLDTYHGMSVRRAGGVAVVTHGVPLQVVLDHRVAGREVCCQELSVLVNSLEGEQRHSFIHSISRIFSEHCTPIVCSSSSPVYHAIPGKNVTALLLKEQKLSWEDIHEMQADYEDDEKSFWICDDSKSYFICNRPPSMLTISPLIEKPSSDQIWMPAHDDQPGGLWTDKQESQQRSHQWITTALSATSQVLGIAMSGRHLEVEGMHQQITEIEPRAKQAIINGFFPSFWNVAEYIPQFMLSVLAIGATIFCLMLFCCCYNWLMDCRTCTANMVNSAGLAVCNRRLVDEENVKLTIQDMKTKIREQAETQTDLHYRQQQQGRKLQELYDRHMEDGLLPPPYPTEKGGSSISK